MLIKLLIVEWSGVKSIKPFFKLLSFNIIAFIAHSFSWHNKCNLRINRMQIHVGYDIELMKILHDLL